MLGRDLCVHVNVDECAYTHVRAFVVFLHLDACSCMCSYTYTHACSKSLPSSPTCSLYAPSQSRSCLNPLPLEYLETAPDHNRPRQIHSHSKSLPLKTAPRYRAVSSQCCQAAPSGIKWYQAVSGGIGRYPGVPGGVTRRPAGSSGIKRYRYCLMPFDPA